MDRIIQYLTSSDWQDRVRGEYLLLKDKVKKLGTMLQKYSSGTLDFKPNCSLEILTMQYNTMNNYLNILELRMNIEHIEIPTEKTDQL